MFPTLACLLPLLSCVAALDMQRQHERLLKNGFIRVPQALPREEALAWRDKILAASQQERQACAGCTAASLQDLTSPCFGCDTSATLAAGAAKSFVRSRRLEDSIPALRSLVRSPALARLAAQAMNVSRVRLYQATAFVKEAGDAPSAWHQDSAATPLHSDKVVTLWLALDDLPVEAGALRFLRGSHLPGVPWPSLRELSLTQRLQRMGRWVDEEVTSRTGLDIVEARAMAAGDATLHLGWTLHAARPNTSGKPRPALAITYFADGVRIHPELLRMEEPGSASDDSDHDSDTSAVRLVTAEGGVLVVRLLADDAGTWVRWLQARPPILIPGQRVSHPELTPVLYDGELA